MISPWLRPVASLPGYTTTPTPHHHRLPSPLTTKGAASEGEPTEAASEATEVAPEAGEAVAAAEAKTHATLAKQSPLLRTMARPLHPFRLLEPQILFSRPTPFLLFFVLGSPRSGP